MSVDALRAGRDLVAEPYNGKYPQPTSMVMPRLSNILIHMTRADKHFCPKDPIRATFGLKLHARGNISTISHPPPVCARPKLSITKRIWSFIRVRQPPVEDPVPNQTGFHLGRAKKIRDVSDKFSTGGFAFSQPY